MTLAASALASIGRLDDPLRDRFLTQIEADGMYRSGRPDHLTASALVISTSLDAVLLTLHAKAGRWFQFGGHFESSDATLLDGARRELTEESGLAAFTLHPEIAQLDTHWVEFCGGGVHHLDVRFVASADRSAAYEVSEESHDVRWFGLDELPELEPSVHALIEIARHRFAGAAHAG